MPGFLMNLMIRELNGRKSPSSNSFQSQHHHTVYRILEIFFFFFFFLQYSGLFLCLYGDGLVCLHIARSESSDTANKAFSVSNLILEVSDCQRFTLASNKTSLNSLRQSDKWPLCSMQPATHMHTHTHVHY